MTKKHRPIVNNEVHKKLGEPNKIEKEAVISHDGRYFMLRIPSEIAGTLGIKKGEKIVFELTFAKQSLPLTESSLQLYFRGKKI